MLPFWLLGIIMIYLTIKSGHRELLRFEKRPIFKFSLFMLLLTAYRLIFFYYLGDTPMIKDQVQAVLHIPWWGVLGVFWEDMSFAVPLVMLKKLLSSNAEKLSLVQPEGFVPEPKSNWRPKLVYALAMGLMMASFGSGHVYQGLLPACLLSLYIPFSVSRGQMYGFGTVILCHILYDLVTVLTLQWFFG